MSHFIKYQKFHKTNMKMAQGYKLLYTMWYPNCDTSLDQVLFYVSTSIITSQYANITTNKHKFIYPRQTAVQVLHVAHSLCK